MTNRLPIRRVAVLGAGVMGAQIAAHLVNAQVDTVLFELPADGDDRNANARKAIDRLLKLEPKPLAVPAYAQLIRPANYRDDLAQLADCDLIIEAIAERLDLKKDLYARIAPHVAAHTILASNTSGLGINELAAVLPEDMRSRFCGVHFFNPPRYMHLAELIPGQQTEQAYLQGLETFLVSSLGKGVIYARDTPNFVGNRIGVFAMLAAMHHAQRLGLAPDVVDALTGPAIGRPKSATFRTADVVGLDTLAHVVEGSAPRLTDDPWHEYLVLAPWVRGLIDAGALGQKSGAGVYRKQGKQIEVLDPETGDYRPAHPEAAGEVQQILALRDPAEKFAALRQSEHPQARFLWAIHRDAFHYAAYLLEQIADCARDVDLALRWGFGWKQGPFEIWQSAGWRRVADWIREDIEAGEAMSGAALPDWVGSIEAVHSPKGSWAPADGVYRSRSELPVYSRQWFPDAVLGEDAGASGNTVFETEGVRLWHVVDDIGILSFRSKQHAVGREVLEGVLAAMDEAEKRFDGVVLWQPREPFSVGANLKQVVDALGEQDFDALETMVHLFQQATGRMRDSQIPVVAAVRGMALGGGCEFQMHCDRTVAALESYIGLVEAGVGLIPAGGGCKELALRAAAATPDGDVFPAIRKSFEAIAMAKVARSAREAQELGLLRATDRIVMNTHEVLHAATMEARALAATGYRPPLKLPVKVAGRPGIANLTMMLVNMREGGFISEHDFKVARYAADALCGGDVEGGSQVSEAWLLRREWERFVELLRDKPTQERIAHMMKTGKPLRN
ncbi:3-hydroxyacyl-CoA dehydrogenase [Natronocella acetinitrilica]|uniref:3-hydroxyacyl-CoA dehydrogenase n=1 Tax=Natronocella acetinitrilica TaxID=414046 RepID=A0AAE3G565_9GAMM|nr:3-hydroxyacyl-CoA dehydrogenase/enoyl-CoA hydratase family protein [Natronocella acetinitrilica]MCP1676090.1 3-hydroxyacyl-CoA dehydrogenase [Natronocella acetinitrilica]